MSNATKTIAEYDALLDRAFEIVSGAPYWSHVYEQTSARLSINDEAAKLTWSNAVSDYDCCTLETESITFPANLLTISDEELKAWKSAERDAYDRRQKDIMAAKKAQQEREERAEYSRLKAKFG